MKLTKRGKVVLSVIGGALAVGLIGGGAIVVVQQVAADTEATQRFEAAEEELFAAIVTRDAAHVNLRSALESAREARAGALALLAVTPATLVAEPSTLVEVQGAVDELVASAALRVNADGSVMLPALPTKTPAPDAVLPEGRQAQLAAAERLDEATAAIRKQSDQLQGHITGIEGSLGALRTAALAAVASAHEKGLATSAPELASDESKAAYNAAVAALAEPAPDADLTALMTAYAQSWSAAVASNEEALRARDPALVEPTYINGILVVNKTYGLPSWFGDGLTSETVAAFEAMRAEAAAAGHSLYISSGFRSYWAQESIYNRYVAADGQAEADRYSARPGHSEHQSGLTFDLNCICESFGHQADGIWVRDNAHRFGFVVRYPQGKEAITGYIWEPWHLRHLGVSVATELYSSGLTLEEYLGITSSYD